MTYRRKGSDRSSGDFRVLVVFVDGILWGVDNVSLLANFGSL